VSGFWEQQLAGLLLFLCASLLVAVSNWRVLRRLSDYPPVPRWPRVSILVPARDEEANIGPCVNSLLAQDYPDLQVLVLDDASSDGTWQVLTDLAKQNRRLRILGGQPLSGGWLGKHWACHQLAQAADGELLLFTDADTRHRPNALKDGVSALMAEKADLLSALPLEEVCSWTERLLVPLIHWSIFSFLPLAIAHRRNTPALAAAIGQFMLFRRQAYRQIGGHAAVRGHAADDLALARRIKARGLRLRLADGSQHVRCRMYQNAGEVYEGLTKNLFAAFDYRLPIFVFVWLWLGLVFLGPIVVVALRIGGVSITPRAFGLAVAAVMASALLWSLTIWRFRFPRLLVILYPASVLLAVAVAFRSIAMTRFGRATWKGRSLQQKNLRTKENLDPAVGDCLKTTQNEKSRANSGGSSTVKPGHKEH
jgi:chlorobactene glucosyltransferase